MLYKRILLKISGEALQSDKNASPIDTNIVDRLATELAALSKKGLQIGLVVGAGNFFRSASAKSLGINNVTADQMGIVSTVLNALVLRDVLETKGAITTVMSAVPMNGIVDHFDRARAIHHLQENRIVIFAGGTGNPLCTTDSAASLRSIEIKADVLLKATDVDGIYSADPKKDPKASLYEHITYQDAIKKELCIMDIAAFTQCRDNNMPICVFNIHKKNTITNIIAGKKEGTLVC